MQYLLQLIQLDDEENTVSVMWAITDEAAEDLRETLGEPISEVLVPRETTERFQAEGGYIGL